MDGTCILCSDAGHKLTSIFDSNTGTEGLSVVQMIKIEDELINQTDNHATLLICDSCTENVIAAYKVLQRCKESVVKKATSPAPLSHGDVHVSSQKCTLIINNITRNSYDVVEMSDLADLFRAYGNISDGWIISTWSEKFARITYKTESAAARAFEAAQREEIKYDDQRLAVTLVSDDYTPADILTNDCLQCIFSYLLIDDRLSTELVCKRWYENCLPGWRTETECWMADSRSTEDKLRILNRCGCYLQDLSLDVSENGDPGVFECMSACCTAIEKFQMSCHNSQPTASQFLELNPLFKQCKNLRRLCLRDLNENFPWEALSNLPRDMVEIHIDSGREDYGRRLDASVDLSKFKNLQALSLMTLDFKVDDLKGLDQLSNLVYLRLDKSNYDMRNIEAVRHFKKLEFLALTNCDIDDNFLISVIRKNKELKYLDISRNHNLTERSFHYLARAELLETLIASDLDNITDMHLSTLGQLEKLNCNGCRSVKDWGLMTLIDSATNLHNVSARGCPVTSRLIASAEESVGARCLEIPLFLSLNETLVKKCKPFLNHENLFLCSNDDDESILLWDEWCVED